MHQCLRGGGGAKSKIYVLRHLLNVATEVAERTVSGMLSQGVGVQDLGTLAPMFIPCSGAGDTRTGL